MVTGVGLAVLGAGNALPTQDEPAQPVPSKRPANYLWAVLIARIYEVFPPRWDDADAQDGEGVQAEPDWDLAAQAVPDYEVDQRVNW